MSVKNGQIATNMAHINYDKMALMSPGHTSVVRASVCVCALVCVRVCVRHLYACHEAFLNSTTFASNERSAVLGAHKTAFDGICVGGLLHRFEFTLAHKDLCPQAKC